MDKQPMTEYDLKMLHLSVFCDVYTGLVVAIRATGDQSFVGLADRARQAADTAIARYQIGEPVVSADTS